MSILRLYRDALWTSLDELGLLVGLEREPDETDPHFIQRLKDRMVYPPNASRQGLVNALSVEFGLEPYTTDDKTTFVLSHEPANLDERGRLLPLDVSVNGSGQLQYVDVQPGDTPPGWVLPPDATHYRAVTDVRVGDNDAPSGYIVWRHADGSYSQLLEFIGMVPPTDAQVKIEYTYTDDQGSLRPFADFSHPDDPQDTRFRGRQAETPDAARQAVVLSAEDLRLDPGSASQKEIAARMRALYGVTWDTFVWGRFHWGDAELAGSGSIEHHYDAPAPSGVDFYRGGVGSLDDLRCQTVVITPSGWMPAIEPGTFYVGNRPFYLYERRQAAQVAGGQTYIEVSGAGWGSAPILVTDTDRSPSASGLFRQGETLSGTTEMCWVDESNPTNNADGNHVTVGIDTNQSRVGLIRFPRLVGYGPYQIPPGALILDARLDLTSKTATADPGTLFAAHALRPWTQEGATWNTYDGTRTWALAGIGEGDVDFNDEEESQQEPNTAGWSPTAVTEHTFNVASGVQLWTSGGRNDGWVLRIMGGTTLTNIHSGKASAAESRPRLSVSYVPPLIRSQWAPRYAYPLDQDIEVADPTAPWAYRQLPDLSALSGVVDSLTWEPSGGQYWVGHPEWMTVQSSGLVTSPALSVTLGDGAPGPLTVSYEASDASGIASQLEDLNVDPTASPAYVNTMLIITEETATSGTLSLVPGAPDAVGLNGIVKLYGFLSDEVGAPIGRQPINVDWENVSGVLVDTEGTTIVQPLYTTQDGSVTFRFKVQTRHEIESDGTVVPMTFRAEARDLDVLSPFVDVDRAV